MFNKITSLFDLQKGEESKIKTLNDVKKNIFFKGYNLWILACAILVASIGLNVNSTAVIIGAMLISPLMGPIVGSGFALAIFDFDLLKTSLTNLLYATIIGLIVSVIYFLLSPFKEVQSEMLARTSPTIFDVGIAFFGGLAGVITISRVEKGTPIAGVAIATALMPPLCTAGYGIATGNIKYFLGAFFLYSINCVFICIATYLGVKYLKYPVKEEVDPERQKRIKYIITAVIIAMLLPSAYFAFSLYNQQKFKQNAENFIEKEFINKGYTIIYKKTNYATLSSSIELAFLNKTFNEEEIKSFNSDLSKFGLAKTKLIIKQNTDNLDALRNDILNEVDKSENVLKAKDKEIEVLKLDLAKYKFDNNAIYAETKTLFPSIRSLSLAKHSITSDDTSNVQTIFLYHAKPPISETDKEKLKKWLVVRLADTSVITISY